LTEALARELAARASLRAKGGERETRTDSSRNGGDDPVLVSIMQSLKGNTARKCNLALGRCGTFWEHESFDHVVRNQEEWGRIVDYVLNNPVKAGLVKNWQDWKWSYRRQP